jgi:sulfoxide reductase heme-binding subunit YedZ
MVLTATAGAPGPNRPRRRRFDLIGRVIKPSIFALCLLPLAVVAWRWASDSLGANPIEATTRTFGDWALRLLLVTLAVTPVRRLSGIAGMMRLRRMLGLFAFFYAVLHVLSYVVLDQFFDWAAIGADIAKRRYITAGMLAFLLLVPLAVTSTAGWVKRLGAKAWQRLHRLIYPAAAIACLHFFWMVKADHREPLAYALILTALLAARFVPSRAVSRLVAIKN